ncbi:hypothetical protein CC86DRAFT_466080 [Ophiobolus disseminans]|uniref:Rhodopsin domain-containing protein n=1 Tax=Ophiobolus disseminans TaxID=1469910 RepID=A0A6A7A1T4_9PLEO|nr:hypothetical protein CC86DRAFT_466080 [Ophiobolus disseminans]
MGDKDYPPLHASQAGTKETVVAICFITLAFAAVILRIWSRVLKAKRLALNDYAVLMALICSCGTASIMIWSVYWAGSGQHIQDVAPQYRTRIFVAFSAGQPVWGAANTCVKISILHLYITIFPSERFRKVCYGTMLVSTLYFLSVLMETFLLCTPVQYNWDKTITGTCSTHSDVAFILAGTTNLIIDVFVVALPMPTLWRLQMPLERKIGVMAMFSLGVGICIISLLRVIYVARMDLVDFTYASADLAVWSVLEPTLGVVNASLPVLRPVLARIFSSPSFDWARSSGGSRRTQGTGEESDKSKHTPSWRDKLQPNSEGGKHFKRIPDAYPLDTINLVGDTYSHDDRV